MCYQNFMFLADDESKGKIRMNNKNAPIENSGQNNNASEQASN